MNAPIDDALRLRAQRVIPNGMYGHLSAAIMPLGYPQFFSRAKGTHLYDADGRRYLDYMCAYGPNLFGYADPEIDAAYTRQLQQGDTMTGPSAAMVELAEAFTSLVQHADWAVFCKNGTDATTAALMCARAHRGRNKILVAKGAYHGAAPWCNPFPVGATQGDRADVIHYQYNDVESLDAALDQAGSDLAGIFASPIKHDAMVDQELPNPDYARRARAICDQHDALLIVDDVRCGLRIARDSSWANVGVQPDLSSWGKAIANGHPISALLGNDRAREAATRIYVTGSFWFSAAPMAAALTTLGRVRSTDYLEHTIALGKTLRAGLTELAAVHGFGLRQTGPEQVPLIMFEDDAQLEKGYLWCQALIQQGIYFHPWHNMFLCAAMQPSDVELTLEKAAIAFKQLKQELHLGHSAIPPLLKSLMSPH